MAQGHHGGSVRRRATARPRLTPLEERAVPSTTPVETTEAPAAIVAIGADAGNQPYVRVIDTATGQTKFSFLAYERSFRGGVRVATGDVNGDGVQDIITAPGPGGSPLIKVWDGTTGTLLRSFMAYDSKFRGGVYVAAGDTNGDGYADIVTGAGEGGGPHVRVFNGAWAVPPLHLPAPAPLPTEPTTPIGGTGPTTPSGDGSTTPPATGDGTGSTTTTGTGTTTTGDGSTTTTGDGSTTTTGDGSTTTTGTTTGDGSTTTTGDGSTTTTDPTPTTPLPPPPPPLDTNTQVLSEFMAYDMKFRGGVRVAVADVTGDGKADIITGAGVGGGPHVRIYDSTTGQVYREFMAFASTFTGGIYVTAGDVDGDGKAEIAVSTGRNGGARVNLYSGETVREVRTFGPEVDDPTAAIRIRMVDVDHDGTMDLLVAAGQTVQVRDPVTNVVKSTFNPLDQQNLGTINLG